MFYFYVKIILAIGQEFNILFLQHSWDFLLIFQVFLFFFNLFILFIYLFFICSEFCHTLK